MANKQITDLDSVIEVDPADLLLVRKSGQAEDASINVSNFITSIGNPSVNGYYQDSYDFFGQIMGLKPSNNTDVVTVGQGMKVSFLATDDIDGQSYITFDGNLSYPLYQYNKALNPIPIDVGAGDYIETIFNNDQFFQVNIPTMQIYTNDYLAEGVVAGDESSTTYTLASAIGVLAQSYYNGMSIIFTSDIESKGNVFVNVDGLGDQVLTDKAGDMIANNLEENQVIIAIYNGTDFIKNYFSESVPEVPELPADAIDDEGDIIIENVPDDNKVQVTVGNAGNDYTTIRDAIDDLAANYGDDGGNRLATILLSDTYTWNEEIALLHNDYAWITIDSNSINGTDANVIKPLVLSNSSISLSGNYNHNSAKDAYFLSLEQNSTIQIKDADISVTNGGILKANNSKFIIEDSILNGGMQTTAIQLFQCYNSTIKDGEINSPNSTGAITSSYYISIVNSNVVLDNINGSIGGFWNSSNNNLTINNCNFTFQLTGSAAANFRSEKDISFNMNNTVMTQIFNTSNNGRFLQITGTKQSTLTDCTIQAGVQGTSTVISLWALKGADITLSGGDYRATNQVEYANNILASDQYTIIRLTNNPIGGTSASGGAIIVTE